MRTLDRLDISGYPKHKRIEAAHGVVIDQYIVGPVLLEVSGERRFHGRGDPIPDAQTRADLRNWFYRTEED